jgi:hypothetical protein
MSHIHPTPRLHTQVGVGVQGEARIDKEMN